METENENTIQADPEPVQNRDSSDQTVVPVEDLLPAIRTVGNEVVSGLEGSLPGLVSQSVVESIQELSGDDSDHPFMTTDFNEYTVTEGLLLVIALILVLNFFLSILRRWF